MVKTVSKEIESEGAVAFPSRPTTSYRYKVALKANAVSFWLEDRKSKQQWASGKIKVVDFLHSDNAIPQARLSDYVSCFINCLEAAVSKVEAGCRYDLLPHSSDSWQLEFVMNLKMYDSAWKPRYQFTMEPIALQAIDIVTAQLRDLQE